MLKDIKNSTKTAYRPIYNDFAIPAKNILAIIEEIEALISLSKKEPWLEGRANILKEALGFKYDKEATIRGGEELGNYGWTGAAWEITINLPGRREPHYLGMIHRRI